MPEVRKISRGTDDLVVIGVANREQVLFPHNTCNPLKAREKVTC